MIQSQLYFERLTDEAVLIQIFRFKLHSSGSVHVQVTQTAQIKFAANV